MTAGTSGSGSHPTWSMSGTTADGTGSLVWTYDTGAGGWGNSELEDYCGWGSTVSPCSSATPNAAALGIQQDLRMPWVMMDLLMVWGSFRLWG